jgi:16S rRNA (guanine527-N7)-methyltransferase
VNGEPDEAELLERGAAALGVLLDPESIDILLRFLDRVYAWNRSAGLTSVGRPHAVRLHLLDSLAVVPLLSPQGSLADLGTGGGLPGIPIAVALPRLAVDLVESKRRRCSFLSETIRDLGVGNCRVIEADVEKLEGHHRYDAAVARAFLSPAGLVAAASRLVRAGGRIVVMGATRDEEIDAAAGRAGLIRITDERFVLPGGKERRRIVVLETTSEPVL